MCFQFLKSVFLFSIQYFKSVHVFSTREICPRVFLTSIHLSSCCLTQEGFLNWQRWNKQANNRYYVSIHPFHHSSPTPRDLSNSERRQAESHVLAVRDRLGCITGVHTAARWVSSSFVAANQVRLSTYLKEQNINNSAYTQTNYTHFMLWPPCFCITKIIICSFYNRLIMQTAMHVSTAMDSTWISDRSCRQVDWVHFTKQEAQCTWSWLLRSENMQRLTSCLWNSRDTLTSYFRCNHHCTKT